MQFFFPGRPESAEEYLYIIRAAQKLLQMHPLPT